MLSINCSLGPEKVGIPFSSFMKKRLKHKELNTSSEVIQILNDRTRFGMMMCVDAKAPSCPFCLPGVSPPDTQICMRMCVCVCVYVVYVWVFLFISKTFKVTREMQGLVRLCKDSICVVL